MIIIIHLMFWNLHKTIGENHNFVGTIGNTIYKEWGWFMQRVTMFPNNSWDYADIALTTGFVEAKQMTLIYDERRLSYLVECKYLLSAKAVHENAQ
jgi:hypothetical protein